MGDAILFRSLSSAMKHTVGRFFDRVKTFAREAILAGAMVLGGPGHLSGDDLAEVDRQAAVQVAYLDQFRSEVEHSRTPAEIADEPSGEAPANAMTAAQFVARVESYSGAVWGGNLNAHRDRVIKSGRFDVERRIHTKPLSEHNACRDCKAESDKGWVPVGTLKPIGVDCECGGIWCDCAFQYRNRVA